MSIMPPLVLTERPADTSSKLGLVRPFTFTTTLPALSTAPVAQHPDASARPNRTFGGQWTAPIRATVPLPRHTRRAHHASKRTAPRTRRVRDDGDGMSEDEREVEPESDSEGELCVPGYRYESISATDGLDAWSFEELRVECYAQSLIARGTKPLPIVQPSLAIPPAFVPRIVPRN